MRDSFSKSVAAVADPSAGSHVPRPQEGGGKPQNKNKGFGWPSAVAVAPIEGQGSRGRRCARAEGGRAGSGMKPGL